MAISALPSAQPEKTRIFVELVVEYPDPELCTYKEYRGKPYYSIKYIENGERYVGFGTYKPEVLSQYLKEYFISSAQPDKLKRCRFEYINACKTVTYPTPDTSKGDIHDAYAVIKALHPIFGDAEFKKTERKDATARTVPGRGGYEGE